MKRIAKMILPRSTRVQMRFAVMNLRGILPFKKKVFCNVCGRHSWQFFPFNGRSNAMCSGCFSLERHRLLFNFIQTEFPTLLNGKCRILHLAPEACLSHQFNKNKQATYDTADNMSQFIAGVEAKPKYCMDITDLKFDDCTFDFVICNHVLEHVPEDQKAMSELHRVLRPNGKGLINCPINPDATETMEDFSLPPEERKRLYGERDHVRYYAMPDYLARLQKAGFSTIVRDFGKETELDEFVNGIMTHEQIVICEKKSESA